MSQVWYFVLPLSAIAALLSIGNEPAGEVPPRAIEHEHFSVVLDDMAREIAEEEGRIDKNRIRQLIAEATAPTTEQ